MRSPEEAKRAEPTDPGRASKSTLAPGTLVIVSTPIGNLGDLTARAADSLAQAQIVACEDTRVTAKLLSAYGIATPMAQYHEHNAARMRPILIDRLRQGDIVALASDAGTPLISDPGYKLVAAAIAEGFAVTAAPGASALLTALVLSGLPSDRFFFAGFLPPKEAARRTEIRALAAVPGTLVFYESPGRLARMLADLLFVLGPRPAAVARELTKKFEEIRRGGLDELAAHYETAPEPKGEIVVVVGSPGTADDREIAADDVDAALRRALSGHSVREAAALVAAETGLPRRQVYARALTLRGESAPAEEA
jgi:16S rRNA (cytidine1402-2'-O)-methyltransferase